MIQQTSMKKAALYSNTQRSRSRLTGAAAAGAGTKMPAPVPDQRPAGGTPAFLRRHQAVLLVFAGMLFAVLLLLVFQSIQAAPQEITQDDIDAAVKEFESRGGRIAYRHTYKPGVTFEGYVWREAFVHPKAAYGVLIHFAEKKPVNSGQ